MTAATRRARHSSRLRLTLAASATLLALIAGRLVQLQVVRAEALSVRAERQWRSAIELPARRGAIYDRDGEALALSVEAYDIYATPKQVLDKRRTAAVLVRVLGGEQAAWQAKVAGDGGFAYLERRADAARAKTLMARRLPGIGFIPSFSRSYRFAPVTAQVVGLSGVDGQGLSGLELAYDGLLAGKPGILEAERDPMGRPLPGGLIRDQEPVNGESIRISLDSDIQYKAQRELYASVKEHQAKGGVIVVMDPTTGEILASASSPGADPTRLTTETVRGLKNRSVTDVFEPGSTMKIVTVAAALEERVAKPWTRFVLPPTLVVGGHAIHDADDRGTEDMSVTEILAHSSNIGAVTLGLKLGPERLYSYIQRFGLTTKTGVDLRGESVGWVPRTQDWSGTSIGTIPFGQGISATPMEMVRVMGVVADRGVAATPHFLTSYVATEAPEGKSVRVISKDTAAKLTAMLKLAVQEGTGLEARIPGYTVAGKTGTAQKPREGARGYEPGAYFASFIGFAPAARPRLVCLVAIDEPGDGAYYGGAVAAPVFSKVMRFALAHLRVPPDDVKGSRAPAPGDSAASTETGSAGTTVPAEALVENR